MLGGRYLLLNNTIVFEAKEIYLFKELHIISLKQLLFLQKLQLLFLNASHKYSPNWKHGNLILQIPQNLQVKLISVKLNILKKYKLKRKKMNSFKFIF